MQKLQFQVQDNIGKTIMYDVIATYQHDKDKNFIIYTDRTLNKEGKLNVYYSLYKETDKNIELIEITDTEDKKIGLELLKEILKLLENDNEKRS